MYIVIRIFSWLLLDTIHIWQWQWHMCVYCGQRHLLIHNCYTLCVHRIYYMLRQLSLLVLRSPKNSIIATISRLLPPLPPPCEPPCRTPHRIHFIYQTIAPHVKCDMEMWHNQFMCVQIYCCMCIVEYCIWRIIIQTLTHIHSVLLFRYV